MTHPHQKDEIKVRVATRAESMSVDHVLIVLGLVLVTLVLTGGSGM